MERGNKYMKNNIKPDGICCFCGKPYTKFGNDIRPLVCAFGDKCCDRCNLNIVLPNRLKFWANAEYIWALKDTETNLLLDKTLLPTIGVYNLKVFMELEDAESFIKLMKLVNVAPVRLNVREDN